MAESVAVADIGGTHIRFALARISGERVDSLSEPVTLRTADHRSLRTAFAAFGEASRQPLPRSLGIGFAGPVTGDRLGLVNNDLVIDRSSLPGELGLDRLVVVNDFAAIGHAVARLGPEHFLHVTGPEVPLPKEGLTTILGPGTGLGIAQLLRLGDQAHVLGTEGGHFDFAPLDAVEDGILAFLRDRFGRVSAERILSGSGLLNIHEALTGGSCRVDDRSLWAAALDRTDPSAVAALARFCLSFGSIAGDVALTHGAHAVVLAGGISQRLRHHLASSDFAERFVAKGRFRRHMEAMPVKLINHPQPGLFGAAAAFAEAYP